MHHVSTSPRATTTAARSPRVGMALATIACFTFATTATQACNRTPSEPARTGTNAPAHSAPANEPNPASAANDPHAGFLPPGHPTMPGGGGAGGGMMGMHAPEPRADDLAWDDPAGWQRVQPSSMMRRAQYSIPAVAGETGNAELTVITFGPGQGGDNDSNIERWYGQVVQADGRATRDVATRRTFTVGAMNVTEVEAAGRIGGAGGMQMPGMAAAPSFEHGRLLAAIVETPNGPWFFKMTGPDQTVAGARGAFETMLRSLHAGAR